MESAYKSSDLVLIVPTKDRPQKITDLLDSLVNQTVGCGRIIIVDGGESIESIISSYADRLPIEYYACQPPGQIRQRNRALSKLDETTSLVGFFDDDIVLENQALEEMLACWNRREANTAGISFNIVNNPPIKHSWLRRLAGMDSDQLGNILKSGYNIPISPIDEDIKSQWLCGGATVWQQKILLQQHSCKEVRTNWAICEDIIFSYPISKEQPLYVCAAARVRHEHVYDHTQKMKHKYYGRNATLWRFYFVEEHPELSRLCFIWMILCQVIARLISGVVRLRLSDIQYAIGQVEGLFGGLSAIFQGVTIISILEEN